VDMDEGFDDEAWDEVVEAYEDADAVEPGPELEEWLDGIGDDGRLLAEEQLDGLLDDPAVALFDEQLLAHLAEFPPATPDVSPDTYRRVLDGFPDTGTGAPPVLRMSLRLVEGPEAREVVFPGG